MASWPEIDPTSAEHMTLACECADGSLPKLDCRIRSDKRGGQQRSYGVEEKHTSAAWVLTLFVSSTYWMHCS